jgi:hypothetical protein
MRETRMGVDDIINKGKQLLEQNRDKIEEALKSEKAEEVSDKVLDGAADAIKKVVPAEHHAKVDEVRENVDKNIGNAWVHRIYTAPSPGIGDGAVAFSVGAEDMPHATRPGLRHARVARRLSRFHIPACARRAPGSLSGQCTGGA